MDITLILSETLSAAVASRQATQLDATLARWQASLRALAPGHADPQLRRYYIASVPNAATSEQLRQELAQLPGVEAAYIKPEATLP